MHRQRCPSTSAYVIVPNLKVCCDLCLSDMHLDIAGSCKTRLPMQDQNHLRQHRLNEARSLDGGSTLFKFQVLHRSLAIYQIFPRHQPFSLSPCTLLCTLVHAVRASRNAHSLLPAACGAVPAAAAAPGGPRDRGAGRERPGGLWRLGAAAGAAAAAAVQGQGPRAASRDGAAATGNGNPAPAGLRHVRMYFPHLSLTPAAAQEVPALRVGCSAQQS